MSSGINPGKILDEFVDQRFKRMPVTPTSNKKSRLRAAFLLLVEQESSRKERVEN